MFPTGNRGQIKDLKWQLGKRVSYLNPGSLDLQAEAQTHSLKSRNEIPFSTKVLLKSLASLFSITCELDMNPFISFESCWADRKFLIAFDTFHSEPLVSWVDDHKCCSCTF